MSSAALLPLTHTPGADEAPARVPTDWRTGAMQRRIRARYAAERATDDLVHHDLHLLVARFTA